MNVGLHATAIEPASNTFPDMEGELLRIWRDLFNLNKVNPDDDFFELGGDSLIAEDMIVEIGKVLHVDLKPSELLEWSTPRQLVALIAGRQVSSPLASNVTAFNVEAKGRPVFLIHGRAGFSFPRIPFLEALGTRQIYIFHAPGYDGKVQPLDSVEDLAATYLDTMVTIQPTGPWSLVSFCAGAWIAGEILRVMQRRGLEADRVVLVDPGIPAPLRVREEMRHNRIARTGIPFLSAAAAKFGSFLARMRFRFYFYWKEGVFVDGYDQEGIRNPRIQRHFHRLSSKRHRRKRMKTLANATTSAKGVSLGVYTQPIRERMVEVLGSEAAIATTAKLEFAFASHRPSTPCLQPVDVIYSRARARFVTEAGSPLNRYFPNKTNHLLGDDHEEAVKSPKTAVLIKQLLE